MFECSNNGNGKLQEFALLLENNWNIMAGLPPPVRVNGTIKLFRYSALGLGFMWGQHRQKRLERREEMVREIEAEQGEIRRQKKTILKQFENREEMLYLGEQSGVIPKANFDEQYPPPDVTKLKKLCEKEKSFVEKNRRQEGVRPLLDRPCEKIDDINKLYPPSPPPEK